MRLIDADALIEKWYEVNNIGPEDRGARFIGYTEIPRFINNAPTVEPTGDLISRAAEYSKPLQTTLNSDLVSRADAIDAVRGLSALVEDEDFSYFEDALNALPSAEAYFTDGNKIAEWIFNPTDAIDLMFAKPKCSRCGFESSDGGNYCPNCGTRMKGGEDE